MIGNTKKTKPLYEMLVTEERIHSFRSEGEVRKKEETKIG
jgi:hypothetical protein